MMSNGRNILREGPNQPLSHHTNQNVTSFRVQETASSASSIWTPRQLGIGFVAFLSGIFVVLGVLDLVILESFTLQRLIPLTSPLKKSNDTSAPTIADGSATSGSVYKLAKMRVFDDKLLCFQTNSNCSYHTPTTTTPPTWPQGDFWNRPHCTNWGAVTTIFSPTAAVEQFVALDGWCLVVTGDVKGPSSYHVGGQSKIDDKLVFLSQERQEELAELFTFVRKTPWNHFARKNVAYLYAIANGAKFIWDFDDDNMLYPDETLSSYTNASDDIPVLAVDTQNNTLCHVFNPYPFFQSTELGVWPRGYPLDKINAPECELSLTYCAKEVPTQRIGIYQSLAEKDPDVDAVYRLTRRLPITFAGAVKESPVLVPPHTMSPMNAQASLFSQIGMWSMFLPTTVHGRVSDIWRSYFAQAVGRYSGMLVTFVGPHVVQDRNAHSYLADMNAEKQLYERSGSLVSYLLNEWSYDDHHQATLEGALERLYVDMYERGIVELQDVQLVQLWISSLQAVGYKFPAIVSGDGVNSLSQARIATDDSTKCMMGWKSLYFFTDVVLVGQFNYDTPAKTVLDWTKRWRRVFKFVDARGPFNNETLAFLNSLGVNTFWGSGDQGFFSPMTNLAESLLLYANSSRGVIMAHDDLLFNVSQLVKLGVSNDDVIIGQFPAKEVLAPHMTVFGNNTYKLYGGKNLFQCNNTKHLGVWWWWEFLIPGMSAAVANSSKSNVGVDFYNRGQSDFLFVPTRFAHEFSVHANWMVQNKVFLELGLPTIVGRLKEKNPELTYKEAMLCTTWKKVVRPDASKWLHRCLTSKKGTPNEPIPYGTFHPVKMNVVGPRQWHSMFDCIVLGNVQSCSTKIA